MWVTSLVLTNARMVAYGNSWLQPKPVQKGGLLADGTDVTKGVWLVQKQIAELGLADAHRFLHHGIEDGLQLAGRSGNDLQHFRGRRLLLQRLGEIVRALAQLVEQPRVLDGDDGLRSEVLEKLDLLVVERSDLLAVDVDRPDEPVLLEHRYVNQRSSARQFGEPYQRRLALNVGLLRPDVGDVLQLLRRDQADEGVLRPGMDRRVALRQLVPFPRRVVQRNASER